jgi:hypothetical protein
MPDYFFNLTTRRLFCYADERIITRRRHVAAEGFFTHV